MNRRAFLTTTAAGVNFRRQAAAAGAPAPLASRMMPTNPPAGLCAGNGIRLAAGNQAPSRIRTTANTGHLPSR